MFDKEKKELTDKINPECVEDEFDNICAHYRIDPVMFKNDDEKGAADQIKFYMQKGWLSFDPESRDGHGAFKYKLWRQVDLGGRIINDVEVSNVNAEKFIAIERMKGGDITLSIRIISACIRESENVVKKFADKDLKILGTIVSFFSN